MLSAIAYYLFILPISWLPYPVLYGLSNVVYFFLFTVFKYRKDVIWDNISNSFPNKTDQENTQIMKTFYKHFCDLILESFKNFSISRAQAKKRVTYENIELFDEYYQQGKSVILMGGHYNNWELFGVSIGLHLKHHPVGIYKPLKNKFFNEKITKSRSKYGLEMIPMKTTRSYFEKKHKQPVLMIFGSDQWPSNPKRAHWVDFLNRDTPFLFGAEKYGKEFDWPIFYGDILRKKRGHFHVVFKELSPNPKKEFEGGIIDKFASHLEAQIKKEPAYWLWSHRRWKKTKEEVFTK